MSWVMVGVAGGAAIAGGVSGAMGSKQSQVSGVNVGDPTQLENYGSGMLTNNMNALSSYVNQGPGAQDVGNATGANRDLASMFQQYSQPGGNLPSAQDMSVGQNYASAAFAPQQTALNQAFQQQGWNAQRQAALMGRSANDPILAAKLGQTQTNMQAQLSAQQNAFGQNYAMQQPMQRLGFAQDRTNVLNGLASQAMSNRQTLAAMGQSIQGGERDWRLATAQHYGNQTSGGGVAGAISGGIAGLGAGMSAARGFGGGGFSGGGSANAMSGGTGMASGYNYNQNPGQFFGMSGNYGMPNQGPTTQFGFNYGGR